MPKMRRYFGGVYEVNAPSPDNIRRLDLNAMPWILAAQRNGMLIDKLHFAKLSKFLGEEKERLTEKVRQQTGFYINCGSPDQIEALLFKKLGLKPPAHFELTASGKRYVVNDEALTSIKSMHECIPTIQEFTECHKIKSSYADVLPVIADKKTGRVHTDLKTTRQINGRVSSANPNLMAQPTRSDLGREIRKGFIAPRGWVLAAIDQSQIEMRFAAHLSQCENMMDTFLRDGDIHVETAARIFFQWLIDKLGRMPTKKEAMAAGMDDMQHRYPSKRIGFGVLYGIMEQGLLDQILVADHKDWTDKDREAFRKIWTLEKCRDIINQWYNTYPEIRAFMQREQAEVRRFSRVHCMFGRVRVMAGANSMHRKIVAEELRAACAFKISASATGSMKLFMAESWQTLFLNPRFEGKALPLICVHDENLIQLRREVAEEFMEKERKIMANCVILDVPVKSGVSIGKDGEGWGHLEK